jgi:hypothetical protein
MFYPDYNEIVAVITSLAEGDYNGGDQDLTLNDIFYKINVKLNLYNTLVSFRIMLFSIEFLFLSIFFCLCALTIMGM